MLNVGRVSVTKIFVTRDSEAKSRAWLHSGWASRAGLLSHMNIYINIYKDINARLTQRHHNQSGWYDNSRACVPESLQSSFNSSVCFRRNQGRI